jgi:cell division GTPase FtsZ
VKAVERALEIVAVGLGQAGGNLAAEFARRGYRALALNTATSDLATLSSSSSLLPEKHRVYIGIDNNDGAGSDAHYGRACVAAHAATIRERVAELSADADLVLLTCGLGGGTGSAVAELVAALRGLSLPLVVLATLPAHHESGVAKVTAVRTVNELVEEPLQGWIFIDNAQLAASHGSVSLDRYYSEINKVIVEQVDVFNRLNDRSHARPLRPLDGEDLRTILFSGGLLSFGSKPLATLDAKSIVGAVHECMEASSVMPRGYSLESTSYLGLALDAPGSLLASTPFSMFEEINESLKQATGGAAVYFGTYRDDDAEQATLRVVASSQALPEGMREMVSAAQREGTQLRSKLDKTVSRLDLLDIEQIQLFRSSAGSIRRGRSVAPEKPRLREVKPEASAANGASGPETEVPLLLVPAAPAPVVESPGPGMSRQGIGIVERQAYEQLVREYQSVQSDEARERVARRLEADARSPNLIARFYSVRAMAKIDPIVFADALRTASRDEDASVRSVAAKALQDKQLARSEGPAPGLDGDRPR